MKKERGCSNLCKTCIWKKKLKNKAFVCKALDPYWSDLFQTDYHRNDFMSWSGTCVCNLYERGKNRVFG